MCEAVSEEFDNKHCDSVTRDFYKLEVTTVIQILLVLISPSAAFSPSVKADIRFNDYNDRFDIDALAKETNRYFAKIENVHQDDDGRRMNKEEYDSYDAPENEDIEDISVDMVSDEVTEENQRRQLLRTKDDDFTNKLVEFISNARRSGALTIDGDLFSFHDSADTGDRSASFEKNLHSLRALSKARQRHDEFRRMLGKYVDALPNARGKRRSIDDTVNPEDKLLMEHAVPVKVNIRGFLQVPELKQ